MECTLNNKFAFTMDIQWPLRPFMFCP